MECIRKQTQAAPFDIDISDAFRTIGHQATVRRNPETEAAIQYLTWALEEIDVSGSPKAASYTRAAMAALRKSMPPTGDRD